LIFIITSQASHEPVQSETHCTEFQELGSAGSEDKEFCVNAQSKWSFVLGDVVPIPISPVLVILILTVPLVVISLAAVLKFNSVAEL
tara:strand:+ start:1427 stop:1687 length:261 start_codon:yes stop_codon:yes gene_type:complete